MNLLKLFKHFSYFFQFQNKDLFLGVEPDHQLLEQLQKMMIYLKMPEMITKLSPTFLCLQLTDELLQVNIFLFEFHGKIYFQKNLLDNNDILFREIENCIPLRLFFHEIITNFIKILFLQKKVKPLNLSPPFKTKTSQIKVMTKIIGIKKRPLR